MLGFEPKNPDFRDAATATFAAQPAMRTLGISIARLDPGEVDLVMAYSADFTQQNGFVHAGIITTGLDNACGIAAFTLMPVGSDILTWNSRPICSRPPRASDSCFARGWSSRGAR